MGVFLSLSDMWNTIFANPVIGTLVSVVTFDLKNFLTSFLSDISTDNAVINGAIDVLNALILIFVPNGLSILSMVFTTGVTFFIVWTILKWIISIIP